METHRSQSRDSNTEGLPSSSSMIEYNEIEYIEANNVDEEAKRPHNQQVREVTLHT